MGLATAAALTIMISVLIWDSLTGLLEGGDGCLTLTERGDLEPIKRHPNFRLFAAMNPATDVGKKDLPPAVRTRFTEVRGRRKSADSAAGGAHRDL